VSDVGKLPTLPEIDMPLAPRVLSKWSRWVSWRDCETGETWVKYSCRHTSEPLPEWCGEDIEYDDTRSFLSVAEYDGRITTDQYATGPYDKMVTVPFVTHGARVLVERLGELCEAVKSGNLPIKPPGEQAPILIRGAKYAP
jgi:hypothetical protein